MRYKPPSIEEVGLKKYLNGSKELHNSYGYDDFVRLVESGLNKAGLAKAFQVERATIYKWLAIYETESGNDQQVRN